MISKRQLIILVLGLTIGIGLGRLLFNHYQEPSSEFADQNNQDPLEGIINDFMQAPTETEDSHRSHESSYQEMLDRMKRKKTDEAAILPSDTNDVGPLDFVDLLSRYKEDDVGHIEEFKESLQQVYQQIPTLKEIQELPPAELHHMPRPLQVMGIYMGDLKEVLKNRHEFYSEGMRYYRTCALNPQFMSAIRSLCLANLIEFGDEREEGLEGRYPKEIVDLAVQVKDWR